MKPYPVTDELAQADLYARSHARGLGEPSHVVRCNVVVDGKRCIRLDGHSEGCDFASDD